MIMSIGIYNIAIMELDDTDRNVISQILAQNYNKISLNNFADEKTDIIISYNKTSNNVPHIILNSKDIKIGEILDQIEKILFQKNHCDFLTYGDYNLDWQKSYFKIGKQEMPLTDREKEIISSLIIGGENGRSRHHLLNYIWGYRSDLDTHTLETHIYRLRQKIETEPDSPTRLITIEGGYKLV